MIEVRKNYCLSAKPVDTIMQVSRFVNADWLVEIKVDAVVPARFDLLSWDTAYAPDGGKPT